MPAFVSSKRRNRYIFRTKVLNWSLGLSIYRLAAAFLTYVPHRGERRVSSRRDSPVALNGLLPAIFTGRAFYFSGTTAAVRGLGLLRRSNTMLKPAFRLPTNHLIRYWWTHRVQGRARYGITRSLD